MSYAQTQGHRKKAGSCSWFLRGPKRWPCWSWNVQNEDILHWKGWVNSVNKILLFHSLSYLLNGRLSTILPYELVNCAWFTTFPAIFPMTQVQTERLTGIYRSKYVRDLPAREPGNVTMWVNLTFHLTTLFHWFFNYKHFELFLLTLLFLFFCWNEYFSQ